MIQVFSYEKFLLGKIGGKHVRLPAPSPPHQHVKERKLRLRLKIQPPPQYISLVEELCGLAALPLHRQKCRVCLFCQSGDKILFFVIPVETNQINSG